GRVLDRLPSAELPCHPYRELYQNMRTKHGAEDMTGKRILFICSHNAARSQMAEGYLRTRYGDRSEAYSAGTQVSTISSYAIRVRQEIGVDISGQRSKALKEFAGVEMDIAVIVCDAAKSACPF